MKEKFNSGIDTTVNDKIELEKDIFSYDYYEYGDGTISLIPIQISDKKAIAHNKKILKNFYPNRLRGRISTRSLSDFIDENNNNDIVRVPLSTGKDDLREEKILYKSLLKLLRNSGVSYSKGKDENGKPEMLLLREVTRDHLSIRWHLLG